MMTHRLLFRLQRLSTSLSFQQMAEIATCGNKIQFQPVQKWFTSVKIVILCRSSLINDLRCSVKITMKTDQIEFK